MRDILQSRDKELFYKFLPHPLNDKQKDRIWQLFTGTENMNEGINQIKDIIKQCLATNRLQQLNEGGNALN